MILIENLMIIFLVTMILGGILMFIPNSDEESKISVIGVTGVIMLVISILALVFLLFYSDSLEAESRIKIAKYEDKIFKQINVINELKYDKDVDKDTYIKERKKLNKYVLDYNSAVREYTEKETRPKRFYFYKIEDDELVTNGTNRDVR